MGIGSGTKMKCAEVVQSVGDEALKIRLQCGFEYHPPYHNFKKYQ